MVDYSVTSVSSSYHRRRPLSGDANSSVFSFPSDVRPWIRDASRPISVYSTATSRPASDVFYNLPPPDTPSAVASRKACLADMLVEVRRAKAEREAVDLATRRHSFLPQEQNLLPGRSVLSKSPTRPSSAGSVDESRGGPFVGRCNQYFEAITPDELSLNIGDLVFAERRIGRDWYHGWLLTDPSRHGSFPIDFIKPMPSSSGGTELLAEALFDFEAQEPFELSFRQRDLIAVVRRVDENWLEGKLGRATGIFPISYVRLLENSQATNHSCQLSNSVSLTTVTVTSDEEPAENGLSTPVFSSPMTVSLESSKLVPSLLETVVEKSQEDEADPSFVDLNYDRFKAIADYRPKVGDELALKLGDVVQVVSQSYGLDGSANLNYKPLMVLARHESTGDFGLCPLDRLQRLY